MQARDSALGVEDEVLPESDAGKEYALAKMQADGTLSADSSFAKARAPASLSPKPVLLRRFQAAGWPRSRPTARSPPTPHSSRRAPQPPCCPPVLLQRFSGCRTCAFQGWQDMLYSLVCACSK